MRLPSLDYILSSAFATIIRFPLACLSALLGTLSAIMAIERFGDENFRVKLILCAALGLVTFFNYALWAERSHAKKLYKYAIQFLLALALVGYYFTLSDKLTEVDGIRFFVLNVTLHLVSSYLVFIKSNRVDEFWNFNKNLFVRILTSGLYSGVLTLGLNFALVAIDNLFEVKIDGKIYGEIFVLIAGLFNTIFFLSGVPKGNEIHEQLTYPKGLKNFTQFVLIPLVVIYLIILLSYESKILILFSLPEGWVSILILVFSVAGILSMLLVYPLRHLSDHKWINQFSKWFFILILPLIGLLFWAIGYRISAYGVTIERYYVFMLACWLTFITLYSILKPNYHIKIIPISLSIVGLISLYGPQSASGVAQISQTSRLKELLQIHQTKGLTFEQRKEISSTALYLFNNFNHNNLQPYFPKAFKNDTTDLKLTINDVLISENIEFVNRYSTNEDYGDYFSASLQQDKAYPAQSYDFMWLAFRNTTNDYTDKIELPPSTPITKLALSYKGPLVDVLINNERITLNPITKAKVWANTENSSDNFGMDAMTISGTSEHYEVRLLLTEVNGTYWSQKDSVDIDSWKGTFYLKVK